MTKKIKNRNWHKKQYLKNKYPMGIIVDSLPVFHPKQKVRVITFSGNFVAGHGFDESWSVEV